jgi:hypothetical protein
MDILKRDRGKHPWRDAADACDVADVALCEGVDLLVKEAQG